MKNENKNFVKGLAIFSGAVILAGSTIGLVLNASKVTNVNITDISYKNAPYVVPCLPAYNSFFEYHKIIVYDENGEHVKNGYVYTPKHSK